MTAPAGSFSRPRITGPSIGRCPGGTVLACNDDIDVGNMILQSAFPIDLEAGQTILIVVDGYDDLETGNYELAIEAS